MELPSYFLADVGPDAVLTPDLLREGCRSLRRNHEKYLSQRTTSQMIKLLVDVANLWLDSESPLRQKVLNEGPLATGFTRQILTEGIDAFFSEITEVNLRNLLRQELGVETRMDEWSSSESESSAGMASRACGVSLLGHISGGLLPNGTWMSMTMGILIRSAQFIKCPTGCSFLPRLFAHAVYLLDPKVGSCLELAEWAGGAEKLESAFFEEIDLLTVTGSDDTLSSVLSRIPPHLRTLTYGHRVSVGFIASDATSPHKVRQLAQDVARDVTMWDQAGCLSPHVVYVESGGPVTTIQVAEHISRELAQRETTHPRGAISLERSAHISSLRRFYGIRAAMGGESKVWASPSSTQWTVVYDHDPIFQPSPLQRFVFVKPVADAKQMLIAMDALRGKVSTVALAASNARVPEIASQLAAWGVTRICAFGRMQQPPLRWRHDGRPCLADLVTWCDLEV